MATIFGLLVGTFARFGYALNQDIPISRNQVAGQLLMLGLCGLLAESSTDLVAMAAPIAGTDTPRALAAAGLALIASKVVARYSAASEEKLKQRVPVPAPAPEPLP